MERRTMKPRTTFANKEEDWESSVNRLDMLQRGASSGPLRWNSIPTNPRPHHTNSRWRQDLLTAWVHTINGETIALGIASTSDIHNLRTEVWEYCHLGHLSPPRSVQALRWGLHGRILAATKAASQYPNRLATRQHPSSHSKNKTSAQSRNRWFTASQRVSRNLVLLVNALSNYSWSTIQFLKGNSLCDYVPVNRSEDKVEPGYVHSDILCPVDNPSEA